MNLTKIEVCELPKVKVMAKKGSFVLDRTLYDECSVISNFLGTAVELYFNDKVIMIYKNTTWEDFLGKIVVEMHATK